MQTNTIKLSKYQYLTDVEPFKSSGIPNNCILHKEVTGCGATTSELLTERNSIIIVPHVPVIKGKQKTHNKKYGPDAQILGIYKGIDELQIETYLNSKAVYKKLITTPEGFKKILKVFANDIETLLKEYFLLFDECERIITDVSYRGAITAPIEWFIKFENKAMVSATPLEFSHPVLASMDCYKIVPDYDYRKEVQVIGTNNVIDTLERQLSNESVNPLFLFVNSTNCIVDIIKILNLSDSSHVYCGDKSVAKLVANKFKRANSEMDLSKLSKHNFLTSRYFSALDIELDYKPNVIMLTDVYTAEHSILDVHTEIIQIVGRFRNGVNNITHITNFNTELESKTVAEARYYLEGCFDTYNEVKTLFQTSNHPGSRDSLRFYLDECPTTAYFTNDGEINDFMVDNYVYEQRVKGYYKSFDNLKAAYNEKQLHFMPTYKLEQYVLGDQERAIRNNRIGIKEQQRETFRQIDSYRSKPGKFVIHNSYTLISSLRALYPGLTEIYDLIGLDGMEKANFSTVPMLKFKKAAQEIKDLKRLEPFVNVEFEPTTERADSSIKDVMQHICFQSDVNLKPTVSLLSKFFDTKRTMRSGQHITIIGNKKDLSNLSPFD